MKKLIQEIHRRSLWQVLGIYLAGSWVALQVVETLAENLSLPEWVPPFATVLLVIGFPVVMATAFVQEGVTRAGQAPIPEPIAKDPEAAPPAPSDERPSPPPTPARGGRHGVHHKLFTWRNAVLGGVGAFALLGLVLGGWLATRALGVGPAATLVAKGVLDERATILLADFESEDENLSDAATESFRIDLSQSRILELASPQFVREALGRMERDANAALELDLARELAVREGLPAVVHGEIHEAGGSYVVSAALVSSEDGSVLASDRQTASDSSEIVSAIDAASNRLRERIGESLADLREAPALERVTTANLSALRKYSQATRIADQGDEERAIGLLEEAVALDSTFAMAYRKLAVILSNRFEQRARAVEALERAFAHRDRLTERERYLTMAAYYYEAEQDLGRAASAYESLLDLDPTDDYALNNAGIIYGIEQRDFARGEQMFRRALEVDSTSAAPYFNLAVVQGAQGEFDEVGSTIETWRRVLPDDPRPDDFGSLLALSTGEYELAESRAREYAEKHSANLPLSAAAKTRLGQIVAIRGRLAEADRHLRASEEEQLRRGLPAQALWVVADRAALEIVRRDHAAAARTLREGLAAYPLGEMDPLDRPYLRLTITLAQAGRAAEAREYLEEWEGTVPDVEADEGYWQARGWVEAAEGDFAEAIEHLRRGDTGVCYLCAVPGMAWAYERAGNADSALALHERYVERPFLFRVFLDFAYLGATLERLGQLYDERGDLESAAKYYAKFVELWAEADEDLQARVRAAQARIEDIVRERG